MPEECIFCDIAKGKIQTYKIYEDKEHMAFLDIRPLNPGHTLVIPKKHYRWVWDIKDIGDFFEFVKRVANAIRKSLKTEWVVSVVIGEAVPHAHVQLIPRFPNDGHGTAINFAIATQLSQEDMKKIADKIRKAL